jgi:hypothetical protein
MKISYVQQKQVEDLAYASKWLLEEVDRYLDYVNGDDLQMAIAADRLAEALNHITGKTS